MLGWTRLYGKLLPRSPQNFVKWHKDIHLCFRHCLLTKPLLLLVADNYYYFLKGRLSLMAWARCCCRWQHSSPSYLYKSRSGMGAHRQKLLSPIKANLHLCLSLKWWSLSLLFFNYFWYFNIITLFLSFCFSKASPMPLLDLFQIRGIFYFINWSYEHIFSYLYIPKYYLLHMSNVTCINCMFVSRAEHCY